MYAICKWNDLINDWVTLATYATFREAFRASFDLTGYCVIREVR